MEVRHLSVDLQAIKNVVSDARGLRNRLQQFAYTERRAAAGQEALQLYGVTEVELEASTDEYGEPNSDGSPVTVTHRFSPGMLGLLGLPTSLLMEASRMQAVTEATVTEKLATVINKGLTLAEPLVAVAHLQQTARTTVEHARQLASCARKIQRARDAVEGRSERLLAEPALISEDALPALLARKREIAEWEIGLVQYQERSQTQFQRAQEQANGKKIPQVLQEAALTSGWTQAGIPAEKMRIDAEGDTTARRVVRNVANRIQFK